MLPRKMIDIYVEKCREGINLPKYADMLDAGADVEAAENTILTPGETVLIPTGLKFAIPPGYEVQVRPRSGISLKTYLTVTNSPGTIDCRYRDEVKVIIRNTANIVDPNKKCKFPLDLKGLPVESLGHDSTELYPINTYVIRKGDRIAQLVLNKVPGMEFIEVQDITTIKGNRGGGFGHSGI